MTVSTKLPWVVPSPGNCVQHKMSRSTWDGSSSAARRVAFAVSTASASRPRSVRRIRPQPHSSAFGCSPSSRARASRSGMASYPVSISPRT
jgi:hypothetical protein